MSPRDNNPNFRCCPHFHFRYQAYLMATESVELTEEWTEEAMKDIKEYREATEWSTVFCPPKEHMKLMEAKAEASQQKKLEPMALLKYMKACATSPFSKPRFTERELQLDLDQPLEHVRRALKVLHEGDNGNIDELHIFKKDRSEQNLDTVYMVL